MSDISNSIKKYIVAAEKLMENRLVNLETMPRDLLPGPFVSKMETYSELVAAFNRSFGNKRMTMPKQVAETLVAPALPAALVLADGTGPIVDLGSGTGSPGIVVACALPEVEIHLVDSNRRKVAFLESVCTRLGLDNAVPVFSDVTKCDDILESARRVLTRANGFSDIVWTKILQSTSCDTDVVLISSTFGDAIIKKFYKMSLIVKLYMSVYFSLTRTSTSVYKVSNVSHETL